MPFFNDGSEEFRIQNRWTKYLKVALFRTRGRYIDQIAKINRTEQAMAEHEDGAFFLDRFPDPSCLEDTAETHYDLQKALGCLSARARQIVVMKVMDDLTFREIAARIGLKSQTVATTYYRALKEMGMWLNE